MSDTRPIDLLPVSNSSGIPPEAVALLDEAMAAVGEAHTEIPGGKMVTIRLENGRQQRVQVLGLAAVPTGGAGLLVATPCAPALPDRFGSMLHVNATLNLGAVELRSLNGVDHFVLSASIPIQGLTAGQLSKALQAIAARGDRLEETLTGGDVR